MKSLINIPLLKEQFKRFWAVGVAFLIIYLLFGLLIYNTNPHHWLSTDFQLARNMVDMLSMAHPILMLMMVLSPLCVGLALFSYHFNRNTAAAYYSFPITKKQLFWTETAVALILMLLPLLIFCLLLLIPIYYTGPEAWDPIAEYPRWEFIRFSVAIFPQQPAVGSVINTLSVVSGFFARMAIGIIFYFSVIKLAVSVSGNRVVAVLLCGALPLIPVGIHLFLNMIASMYVFGYNFHAPRAYVSTFNVTNPLSWRALIETYLPMIAHSPWGTQLYTTHLEGVEPRLWINALVYIGISVILVTISYFCSQKRKLERTGDSVVFTVINNACVFMVSMFGMILTGYFMMSIFRSRAWLYIGFVLGFAIFYLIAQMIAERTINVIHKFKSFLRYGGVIVGIYVIIMLVTNFGLSFYVNRVPAAENVAGVSLDPSWRWSSAHAHMERYVRDPEAIERTLEMHRYILANRRHLQGLHWQNLTNSMDGTVVHVPFAYQLQDGTTMYRGYFLNIDFLISSGLGDLRNSAPIILADAPILDTPEIVQNVIIFIPRDYGEQSQSINITYSSDIASLFEAIKKDFVETRAIDWSLLAESQHHVSVTEWDHRLHINMNTFRQYWHMNLWMDFSINGEHTRQWLKTHGYYDLAQ